MTRCSQQPSAFRFLAPRQRPCLDLQVRWISLVSHFPSAPSPPPSSSAQWSSQVQVLFYHCARPDEEHITNHLIIFMIYSWNRRLVTLLFKWTISAYPTWGKSIYTDFTENQPSDLTQQWQMVNHQLKDNVKCICLYLIEIIHTIMQ